MNTAPRTLEDVLMDLARHWQPLGLAMLSITLVSVLIGYLLWKTNRSRALYRFMSLPIFLTTLPGVFFIILIVYLLLFAGENLLRLPLFFFFPPLWMALSLYLYRRFVDFSLVPGFDRLGGLALFSALLFAAAFLLARLRIIALIWISPVWLVPIAILFYLAFRLAWKKLIRS